MKNMTKICPSPSLTFLRLLPAPPKTHNTPTTSMTSIRYRTSWEFPGKHQKTYRFRHRFHSLASSGIYPREMFQSRRRRRASTWRPLLSGSQNHGTSFSKSNNSTENSCMPPLSSQVAEHISLPWNPCYRTITTVLTCHIPLPERAQQISGGGSTPYANRSSPDTSQAPARSSIPAHIQMLAQAWASQYGSTGGGVPGNLSQGGKLTTETSVGRKRSASSSSSTPSFLLAQRAVALRSMETTEASSKVGGRAVAGTQQPTPYSSASTVPQSLRSVQSSRDMSQALTTQLTTHPEASTHPLLCFSHQYQSQNPSVNSSPTSTHLGPPPDVALIRKAMRFSPLQPPKSVLSSATPSKPLPITNLNDKEKSSSKRRKITYPIDLTPLPSALRPVCSAKDRLQLWHPPFQRANLTGLAHPDMQRIQDVLVHTWAESTKESYGSGLLVYHVFCDAKSIPEAQRAPAPADLISAFIAYLAGSYAGRTISNYVHGIRAWHILHGMQWALNDNEIDALLKAAENLAPPSSKRKKRRPYTIAFITSLLEHLDPNIPLDASVASCLTTTFYCAARVGEFTIPKLDAFNPTIHVKPSDVRAEHDRNDLQMTVFHLPRTKTTHEGEDVSWAKQHGPTDPETLWNNHKTVNNPPPEGALFSYRHKNGHRPLTKQKFLARLTQAARAASLDPLQGHGIRIGATLEYLLRGIPFDVVKSKGRWASDAFQLYLRKHAQIMAPYMQATPAVHDQFIRYTMPSGRR
ncbi:hypothetical protein BJ138DRAFT_1069615 [Hygrophoropsis aurantiaca]|uniref:Uncharacterized protein n=1 Tax=Hygrophoropsis aurantiaca TaxID=72124 RepID=A0ACB8A419_9AGAM|nr:hypothetical protein BJ138DRAFT_1069615 [Hygrophoropsis aurantiaca]